MELHTCRRFPPTAALSTLLGSALSGFRTQAALQLEIIALCHQLGLMQHGGETEAQVESGPQVLAQRLTAKRNAARLASSQQRLPTDQAGRLDCGANKINGLATRTMPRILRKMPNSEMCPKNDGQVHEFKTCASQWRVWRVFDFPVNY